MLLQERPLINAPGAFAVAQIVTMLVIIGVIAYLGREMIRAASSSTRSNPGSSQGERSSRDFGSFYVVAFGITAVFFGFIVMLLFADTFTNNIATALGFLTALFGAITGLVGTYFGVKSSSDAREGAQRLAASPAGDTTPPDVTSTSPVDGAVEVRPDIHPTATFSKDMDSATINPDTFKLLDQASSAQVQPRATGDVVYDPPTRTATFTPANPLGSGKTYAATITAAVRDQAGNTLARDYTWHFTVA
jgi:Bacterial Ig-like domain